MLHFILEKEFRGREEGVGYLGIATNVLNVGCFCGVVQWPQYAMLTWLQPKLPSLSSLRTCRSHPLVMLLLQYHSCPPSMRRSLILCSFAKLWGRIYGCSWDSSWLFLSLAFFFQIQCCEGLHISQAVAHLYTRFFFFLFWHFDTFGEFCIQFASGMISARPFPFYIYFVKLRTLVPV